MDHLAKKLNHFAPLSQSDLATLREIGSTEEVFEPHAEIVGEGESPRSVFVIQEGFAYRYRTLRDGSRQIITFLIPGDICDLHVFLLNKMDHSIETLTRTRLAAIRMQDVVNLVFQHPHLSAALWWSMLQEEAILRERVVALGRRNAEGRIGYLLCELLWRLQAVGEADDKSYELPLTQEELADTLGLTSAYVNRVLKAFRARNLITLSRGALRIDDIAALRKLAGFTEGYLHFDGAPEHIRRYLDERKKPQRRSSSG